MFEWVDLLAKIIFAIFGCFAFGMGMLVVIAEVREIHKQVDKIEKALNEREDGE